MKKPIVNRKVILIQGAYFIGFWIVFLSLQNQTVYSYSLGLVADNWQKKNGKRNLVHSPYERLTNENYINWDGTHYYRIKNKGYQTGKDGGDYIFAFFPLFPFIWSILNIPPIGVLFLNYGFFSIAIVLLLSVLSKPKDHVKNVIFSLSLPGTVIFLMPYTEATYMLMVSISIYGIVKKNYWLYFLGIILASLTRPSFTFLLLSLIGTELFFLIKSKDIKSGFVSLAYRITPLILGTLAVSLIHYSQGSGSFFKFIEVQKYWNNVLSVPHKLRDWSHEGFAINVGVVFLVFFPLLTLLFYLGYNQLKPRKARFALTYNRPKDYLLLLSILYVVGSSLFIILFRGGSLHCLFRFTIDSPFFYVLIFIAFDYLKKVPINFRLFSFSTLALVSILVLGLADYSTFWNFSDFGLFVLITSLLFWLIQDLNSNKAYSIGQSLFLLISIIWATYLFNTYIAQGWIFA
jgi:hypothetical protein